jgi:hypothetical protein
MVGIARFAGVAFGTGAEVGGGRNFAKGMRLRSSAVVLMRTGDPISSSRDFNELQHRVADRFVAILSFKSLKSAKSWVEGMCGDADALRACRTTFGDKKASLGG